jgi:1-acyl-sn-glycerol-3-phosphate acyltransferase
MLNLKIFLFSLVYTSLMIISFILIVPFALLPTPLINEERRWGAAKLWADINFYLLEHLCGLKYKLLGQENIPDERCVLFVKHSSVMEVFIGLRYFSPSSWVGKYELMYVPIFRGAFKKFKLIPVKRGMGRTEVEKVVKQGVARLDENKWLIIFPEGHRLPYKQTKKYGLSGSLLAKGSGKNILPISHNAGRYWKRRGLLKLPGTVYFSIGPVISTQEKTIDEINKTAQTWIQNEISVIDEL